MKSILYSPYTLLSLNKLQEETYNNSSSVVVQHCFVGRRHSYSYMNI